MRIAEQRAGEILGVGLTPRISFEPPTLGKPRLYQVRLYRSTAPGVRFTANATFSTTETSFVIPPGILEVGMAYYLRVSALTQADPSRPHRTETIGSSATAISNVFSP